jgi:hypothetical protein
MLSVGAVREQGVIDTIRNGEFFKVDIFIYMICIHSLYKLLISYIYKWTYTLLV